MRTRVGRQHPPRKGNPGMRRALLVVVPVAILALTGCGGGSANVSATTTTSTGIQGPSEVAAEPVDHAGANPFTPPVGKDRKNAKPPKRAVSTGHPVSYKGNLPGLYGGTMDYTTCDKQQLVTYLQQTPDKASAWSQALGISTTEISTYVDD